MSMQGTIPVRYTDPDGNVTEEQNKNRNQYQNGYAPPTLNDMRRLVAVGLFKEQGFTKTHNFTQAQNTKEGRMDWANQKTSKTNIDFRGKTGTIFEGMQFIYNNNTGDIVVDEVNKGTFDYRSPYGNIPYFSHKSFDIDTWVEWGTGGADNKDDVLMSEDLWNQVDAVLKDFESGKIKQKEAKKRIQNLLPSPPTPPSNMKGGVEL